MSLIWLCDEHGPGLEETCAGRLDPCVVCEVCGVGYEDGNNVCGRKVNSMFMLPQAEFSKYVDRVMWIARVVPVVLTDAAGRPKLRLSVPGDVREVDLT